MWELRSLPYYRCEPLRNFERLRAQYFDQPLAGLNFEPRSETEDDHAVRWRDYVRTVIYTRDRADCPPLYVLLTANQRHRDAPNHLEIRLGEGEATQPEQRFNSISLETLVYAHEPTRQTEKAERYGLYGIPAMDELKPVMATASEDLLSHGIAFLRGRLEEFRLLRSRENRHRPPFTYTWHHGLDERLQRRLAEDAETKEALRRKYAAYRPDPVPPQD